VRVCVCVMDKDFMVRWTHNPHNTSEFPVAEGQKKVNGVQVSAFPLPLMELKGESQKESNAVPMYKHEVGDTGKEATKASGPLSSLIKAKREKAMQAGLVQA